MINILKESEPVKCIRCGCEFTFEKDDVEFYYTPVNDKLSNFKEHAQVICPTCKNKIEL